jgi:hypothetical protein
VFYYSPNLWKMRATCCPHLRLSIFQEDVGVGVRGSPKTITIPLQL